MGVGSGDGDGCDEGEKGGEEDVSWGCAEEDGIADVDVRDGFGVAFDGDETGRLVVEHGLVCGGAG